MRFIAIFLMLLPWLLSAQKSGADTGVDSMLDVKRIYVSPLEGGAHAAALRELIISSLSNTKLFILTDKVERADAVLKGAADDTAFTDTFDSQSGQSAHDNVSKNSGSSVFTRASGIALGDGGSLDESHHIKERKHEAYAAVRLCNKDGDVLWSTTQESLGAKFRGAGADVAARIARQIVLDYERERRLSQSGGSAASAAVTPSAIVK